MQYRTLGSTGLVVSEIGFGGFAIGGHRSGNSYGPVDDTVSIAAVRRALELGCVFFDTADVYGYGHGELILGRALQVEGARDALVATKVGGDFASGQTVANFSPAYIVAAVDASLRRLGRDHIDLYQLHNPSEAVIAAGDAFAAMERLRDAGKIRAWGVSIHDAAEGRACLRDGRPQSLQLPYNLSALLEPDHFCDSLFAPALAANVGLIAREPLAAGFLSDRHGAGRSYGPGDIRGGWPQRRRDIYTAFSASLRTLTRPDVSLAQAALRYCLDEPAFAVTLAGMKTPAQVEENIAACDAPPFSVLCAHLLPSGNAAESAAEYARPLA